MAKDIKLYKDGHEVVINETQLDNFLELGFDLSKVLFMTSLIYFSECALFRVSSEHGYGS